MNFLFPITDIHQSNINRPLSNLCGNYGAKGT